MRDVQVNQSVGRLVGAAVIVVAAGFALSARAAVPGITGPGFNLVASPGSISQPDGTGVYSWGLGCDGAPAGYRPAGISGSCGAMQVPAPTLIVNAGQSVSVVLRNNLPAAAGNTSLLFPGFKVSATATAGQSGACTTAAVGVLATEVRRGCKVTYTFTATKPGTYAYYSGTRGDVQVEMGLYGTIIVLPTFGASGVPAGYSTPAGHPATCRALGNRSTAGGIEIDYRLAAAAYDHPSACYEREYLFQLSEVDLAIHEQVEQQKDLACTQPGGCMVVTTEPYHPTYFMVNGRSFPDVADPNYGFQYPSQPYNGNPHMHPGELVLLRVVGTGRWQHPLHEHGNHIRILARDGNLLLSPGGKLAGPLLFTTTSTPGETMDGIYQWTGKGINWDIYAHASGITAATCVPDANGYYTTGSGAPTSAPNYYEWCADHQKSLEARPFGNVGSGGPVTLPDPTIFAMGAWYSGSPYFGTEASARAAGTTPIPPSGTVGNTSGSFAFMWHSHNEREITTNNAFPGGMMMMMLVDPWDSVINEAN
jgi:FtsP/CotA-like multicopper oxidase with cupredoxin domain